MRLLCMLGFHKIDPSRTVYTDGLCYKYCMRCNREMVTKG